MWNCVGTSGVFAKHSLVLPSATGIAFLNLHVLPSRVPSCQILFGPLRVVPSV
jgi:hypothetical protein